MTTYVVVTSTRNGIDGGESFYDRDEAFASARYTVERYYNPDEDDIAIFEVSGRECKAILDHNTVFDWMQLDKMKRSK